MSTRQLLLTAAAVGLGWWWYRRRANVSVGTPQPAQGDTEAATPRPDAGVGGDDDFAGDVD